MPPTIFAKESRLKPRTMATVAERRFDDAEALSRTGENARANGVAYLAGFVIEILLKARLVARYPAIARKRHHEVNDVEREIWKLIWRQHDLEAMLGQMKELEAGLKARGERDRRDHLAELKKICHLDLSCTVFSPLNIDGRGAGVVGTCAVVEGAFEMTRQEAQSLVDALREKFGAQVEAESVDDNGRYRFAVVAPQFQQMTQLQRQDAVWPIVDATLPRPATLDVSLILAFAPGELVEAGDLH